jgi:hypothetical protein
MWRRRGDLPIGRCFSTPEIQFPLREPHVAALEIECQRRPTRLLSVGISATMYIRPINITSFRCERALLSMRVTFYLYGGSGWSMSPPPSILFSTTRASTDELTMRIMTELKRCVYCWACPPSGSWEKGEEAAKHRKALAPLVAHASSSARSSFASVIIRTLRPLA